MSLKRGAAYWVSSLAGLLFLLAIPAVTEGIEGLHFNGVVKLAFRVLCYVILVLLLYASFHWQLSVTSGTVAVVELIRIFSCVIFLIETRNFSEIIVFTLCITFFAVSLIFAVIHYGKTQA